MQDVLISGKASFKIDVPYKLIETGEKGEKPLIVYLHGYNQNIEYFEKKVESLLTINAYHLFIQGPYPIYDTSGKLNVEKWGRAWYLYDGNQEQFIKSMEIASEFIQDIIHELVEMIDFSRICLVGYSMGGYLAGYFAFSRWKSVNELVVIGGRIKTETFEGNRAKAKHLKILALHGKNDSSVYPEPQQKCIQLLQEEGFDAGIKLLDTGHNLNENFFLETKNWLLTKGYIET